MFVCKPSPMPVVAYKPYVNGATMLPCNYSMEEGLSMLCNQPRSKSTIQKAMLARAAVEQPEKWT